ncbi:MAG: leucine-rich repeat protein, partial [Clostridia bacterium]|nr:leucine-rich repeat protein [Clostridia bacterium]
LLMPGAFEHSSIEEIILPENITSIPADAFSFCVDLEKVALPPVVTDIGNLAFFNCQQLSYLEIPAGLKYIGGRAFKDCVSLQAVRFLGDCEGLAIGTEAFGYCKSMEYIYLPDGTASIGSYAFSECRNMKVIHIPPTVNEIADDAFAGCRSTLVISGSAGSYAEAYAIEHGITFENESVWIHVESAFIAENSDGLPIALALSYESAEAEEAVLASFCNGLPVVQMWEPTVIPVKAKRIVMPLMLESFVSDNGIDCEELVFRRELEQFAFWLNDYEGMDSAVKSIRNIEFSNGTQNFWVLENGFSGTGVREVRLPANLMYVEQEAFAYCPNLETVIFPDVIEFMDARCFRESPALKEIELPEGDISLCCIFAGCRQLETVILPESVKSLPFCSFAGCTSLKDVWIYSRELELEYETSVSHFHYELEKYYDPDFEAYDGTDLWTSILHTWETHLPHPFADSPSLTIHGYAGSDVEAFCSEWGLNFEPIPENE